MLTLELAYELTVDELLYHPSANMTVEAIEYADNVLKEMVEHDNEVLYE